MKSRSRIFGIAVVAFIFATTLLTESTAQRGQKPFSHNTRQHKEGKFKDCSSCHELPTPNWTLPRKDKQEPFPDVTNFPYKKHATCNACHIKEVYSKGAVFCGSCHVVASMQARGGPAGLLPFPVPSHPRQFATVFPHDKHLDLMASHVEKSDFAIGHFVSVVFRPDDGDADFRNCTMCHQVPPQVPKFTARIPVSTKPLAEASVDNFTPSAGFFKDIPRGHASCFTCHYQNVKPVGVDCAGCHQLTDPFTRSTVVKRYSLKFDHLQTGKAKREHVADCMTCHLRIVKNSDLRSAPQPDVPIFACVSCHKRQLTSELGQRKESIEKKQPAFQCIYCHTTAVGRFPVPLSHQKDQ